MDSWKRHRVYRADRGKDLAPLQLNLSLRARSESLQVDRQGIAVGLFACPIR